MKHLRLLMVPCVISVGVLAALASENTRGEGGAPAGAAGAAGGAKVEAPPVHPALAALHEQLTPVLRERLPRVVAAVQGGSYTARFETMIFTVHAQSRSGEYFGKTGHQEGPNARGILLRVRVEPGPYQGAAAIPQTLRQPYWRTFVNALPLPGEEGEMKHLWVSFSFGDRVDPEVKRAVLARLGEPPSAVGGR